MLDAYIYDGLRSPFGRSGGALSGIRPDDLLAEVIRPLMSRTKLDGSAIDDVIVGCGNQAGEDSRCVARHAALRAGLPIEVPGTVVQRNCGSGLGAMISAAHALTCGEGDVVISGGVESMSRSPFVIGKHARPFARQLDWYDSAVGARFPNPRLEKEFGSDSMPQTADNLAQEHGISRDESDAFALRSQQGWARAHENNLFDDEITPVAVPGGRGRDDITVDTDEHPRPKTDLEGLSKLRALNPDGVTTAGSASGLNDGAVALMMGSRAAGDKIGREPIARILASGVAGVPPRTMGYGPVPASRLALERAGLALSDMSVIEINEAFAAQVLACMKGLDIADGDDRVNPNGGAIALGHPLGASGPRIALTAIHEAKRRGGKYALATMCIGMGQGIAIVMEVF
ncbi:MAG: acetyl-CoA C-acyltransferase [Pseudomonadota bacterium]|uniref:acetyl-CoA C-acyltransferase n=1 Tax=Roseovarius salincola TaxID=2978479 RepID=UPI0022A886A7|nr:acetyl-CoA C-acyltransferase [Roseovarius sp. EGI FJ00037]MCZ0812150.1 acetyl-CoA C-acyltransferase [Roseovarius sp. EGI FJ00037]